MIAQDGASDLRASGPRALAPQAVSFLATATVSTLALVWYWPIDALDFDSTRDLLIARDCAELNACASHGPQTSFPSLYQGVLWNDFLAICSIVGMSPAGIGRLLAGLSGGTIAAACRWATRNVSMAPTLPIWLLCGSACLVPVVLWSPTLALPVVTVATLATLEWLKARSLLGALFLGVVWGAALDLYLAAAPLLFATVVLASRRRALVSAFVVGAVACGTSVALSPGAWLAGLRAVGAVPELAVAVAACTIALGAVACRWRALGDLGVFVTMGVAALLLVGCIHRFEPRYLLPAWPAIALLAGQAIGTAPARSILATAGLIGLCLLQRNPVHSALHYADVQKLVVDDLLPHGIAWPAAMLHIQGRLGREVGLASAVFLPLEPTRWLGEEVAVEALSPLKTRAFAPRIALEEAVVCDDARSPRCAKVHRDWTPHGAFFPFASRVEARRVAAHRTTRSIELRLRVRPGPVDWLTLFPQFPGDPCPWTLGDGSSAVELGPDATEIALIRPFWRTCPPPAMLIDWFPAWQESMSSPAATPVEAPPSPRSVVLPPAAEVDFARLAALLAAERKDRGPDVAIAADHATLSWGDGATVTLRAAGESPWFVLESGLAHGEDANKINSIQQTVPIAERWYSSTPHGIHAVAG